MTHEGSNKNRYKNYNNRACLLKGYDIKFLSQLLTNLQRNLLKNCIPFGYKKEISLIKYIDQL